MKKLVFLIFAVLYISCLMSQDVIIPRTKTTTEVEFSAIKTACEFDHVMSYYYDLAENKSNSACRISSCFLEKEQNKVLKIGDYYEPKNICNFCFLLLPYPLNPVGYNITNRSSSPIG